MGKAKESKTLAQRHQSHTDKRVAEIRQRKKDFRKRKKEEKKRVLER